MGEPPAKGRKGSAPRRGEAAVIPGELAVECLIHELRQPMLGLRASLGFLSREIGPEIQANEDWQIVLAQLTRMEELFGTYREVLGQDTPEPVTFDAGVVAERAVALLAHRVRSLAGGFTLSVADDLWSVHGSPNALLHGLLNLLKNALEALVMRPESGRVAVRLYNGPAGQVEIRMSNDGPAVPPEDRERIFEPRVSTKAQAGGGLGLFVARTALARYGASLEVVPDDDPQRLDWAGTELAIRLPSPPADEAKARADLLARVTAKRRALAVDDEETVLAVVEMALTGRGFDVVTASAASQGLALLHAERFDVLIVDKNLAGASGVEVAVAARASDPLLAILMITAYASADSADDLLEADIDDYLRKPFEIQELVDAVETAIVRRRTQAIALPKSVAPSARAATLVVSGDAIDRGALATVLEDIGYTCRYFDDLRTALEHDPEAGLLVVSDAHFSHGDRQLLVERRKDFPQGRVIILTANRGVDVRVGAILVGARLVLSLPLPERIELVQTLREAVGRP